MSRRRQNMNKMSGSKTSNPAGSPKLVFREQEGQPVPGEFKRFEDLSRKLVSVPKRELDEKRRDES
jgi:hypothetical protein